MRTLLATIALLASSLAVEAAELLMFEQPGCPWCRRWHEDVGPGYAKSAEGKIAPLRRLQLGDRPAAYTLKQSVTVTPTFIVVDDNGTTMVGRLDGLPDIPVPTSFTGC
jgi:hypothetical protein